MCMNRVELNLKKVGNQFIGTGYKVMSPDEIPKSGKWVKAIPWDDSEIETAADDKEYYPGFHIWTSLQGAKAYLKDSGYSNNIYQVSFKEVVCYGDNYSCGKNHKCVVTNYIRYDKVVL